jgi:hypothetical protein
MSDIKNVLEGGFGRFRTAGFDGAACAASPTLKRHEASSWAPLAGDKAMTLAFLLRAVTVGLRATRLLPRLRGRVRGAKRNAGAPRSTSGRSDDQACRRAR